MPLEYKFPVLAGALRVAVFFVSAGAAFGQIAFIANSGTNFVGFADSGLSITLNAASANSMSACQNFSYPHAGALTATWNGEDQNAEPTIVLEAPAAATSLDAVVGDESSGEWTLSLTDAEYGERGPLTSWGLVVTTVPEPGTSGLLALGFGGLAGMRWLRRR